MLYVPDRSTAIIVPPSHVKTSRDREAEKLIEELDTKDAEDRLHPFMQQAWKVAEPDTPFVDGWHLGYLAEHLEAVTLGQIMNLAINEPPGFMKSFQFSVLWNCWEWIKFPHYRYLCSSHDQTLSTRDNQRVRDITQSQWYQNRWPHVQLRDDDNQKTQFKTTRGGWRIATSVKGRGIGEHPHRKIMDDLHKPTQLLDEEDSADTWTWFTQTMGPRGKGLNAATVIGGQRLGENDIFAKLMEERKEQFVFIVLSMRHDPKIFVDLKIPETTVLGIKDPREPGDLLWPERYPEEKVKEMETDLEEQGTAAQLQQRPAPATGSWFDPTKFQIIHKLPDDVWQAVRYWDTAATEGGKGAQTAGVRMVKTKSNKFIITDIETGRWADPLPTIKLTAKMDGPRTMVREEQEPGGSGKRVIASSALEMAGFDYEGVKKVQDKPTAAIPLRRAVKNGFIYIYIQVDPTTGEQDPIMLDKVKKFLAQMKLYPYSKLKDMGDAAAGAYNFLALEGEFRPSLEDGAEYPLYY